ncbi:hypothetical protein ROR02_25600 [Pararhodospirillum oryzae]|uniref:Uncharacterized protein n=1 Tax=Pararhodospirillum oryzae TaxID=478448 RepID=A0A512HAF2_9PROT|nr:hypothetical protein ROR02_25600 [Pararhodospirillum oryzae]
MTRLAYGPQAPPGPKDNRTGSWPQETQERQVAPPPDQDRTKNRGDHRPPRGCKDYSAAAGCAALTGTGRRFSISLGTTCQK